LVLGNARPQLQSIPTKGLIGSSTSETSTYASNIFAVNELDSANVSNWASLERLPKALADGARLLGFNNGLICSWNVGLYARDPARGLTLANGCTKFSGMSVV
jgi:hypothetical protein